MISVVNLGYQPLHNILLEPVADLGGFRRFRPNPPLGGLHLVLRSTELEPPFLATELRKLLLWLLCMLQQKIHSKIDRLNCMIGLVPVVVDLKRSKMGVVLPESGRGF